MARNFFDGVMNFLGLVDASNGNNGNNGNNRGNADDDFDRIDRTRSSKNARNGSNTRRRDEAFEDEPRVNFVPRSNRNAASNAAGSTSRTTAQQTDEFEADDIWGGSASRPEYGTRSGSSARTSAGRYTASAQSRTSAYDRDSYRSTQSDAQSSYRSTGARRNSSETNYYGGESNMSFNDQYGSQYATQSAGQKPQTSSAIAMFRIKTVDECKNVIRTLLDKKSVLLSLEEMDSVQAQRVVDTMSGATFAIGAKMNRASARSWLLTPNTVEVDDKHAINSNTIL